MYGTAASLNSDNSLRIAPQLPVNQRLTSCNRSRVTQRGRANPFAEKPVWQARLTHMIPAAACGSSALTGMARQAVSFSFDTRTSAAAAATSVPSASRAALVLGTNGQLV